MKTTQEDAEGLLNYCKTFGVILSDADFATLNRIKDIPKNQELSEKDRNDLKRLCCEMVVFNPHEDFQDSFWDGAKESARAELKAMDNDE